MRNYFLHQIWTLNDVYLLQLCIEFCFETLINLYSLFWCRERKRLLERDSCQKQLQWQKLIMAKSTYILLYNTRSTYILFCNTRSTYILLWAEIMNIITIITSPLSPHPQHHHRRLHNGKMLKYFDTADLAFNCFPFPLYKYSMILSSGTLMMMILF